MVLQHFIGSFLGLYLLDFLLILELSLLLFKNTFDLSCLILNFTVLLFKLMDFFLQHLFVEFLFGFEQHLSRKGIQIANALLIESIFQRSQQTLDFLQLIESLFKIICVEYLFCDYRW